MHSWNDRTEFYARSFYATGEDSQVWARGSEVCGLTVILISIPRRMRSSCGFCDTRSGRARRSRVKELLNREPLNREPNNLCSYPFLKIPNRPFWWFFRKGYSRASCHGFCTGLVSPDFESPVITFAVISVLPAILSGPIQALTEKGRRLLTSSIPQCESDPPTGHIKKYQGLFRWKKWSWILSFRTPGLWRRMGYEKRTT